MKRHFGIVMVILLARPAWGILGDLNRDGVVDLGDFFLFADQFGKTGTPGSEDTVVVVPSLTDPPPPAGLRVTATIGAIQLSWTASRAEGLLGYNVYRSTRSDLGYGRLAGTEGTPFTTGQTTYDDHDVATGGLYFYKISTLAPQGESGLSAFGSATVQQDNTPPDKPTELIVQAVEPGSALQLTWKAPTRDRGSPTLTGLASYIILRRDPGNTSLLPADTVAATTPRYIDDTVQRATTYFYAVRAVDDRGNVGDASATASYRTPGPDPPAGLSATPGVALIRLRWSASRGNGLLGYTVYRSLRSDQSYEPVAGTEGTPFTTGLTSYEDTALDENRLYFYKVSATSTQGEGLLSSFTGAQTLPDDKSPGAPTNVNGAPAGDDQLQLEISWRAPPTDDRGTSLSGLSGYRLYRSMAANGTFALISTTSATRFRDTGLEPRTSYYYQIEAYDPAGNVGPRSAVAATTGGVLAPSGLSMSLQLPCGSSDPSVVTVAWQASPGAITRYEVQRTEISDSTNDSDYQSLLPDSQNTLRTDNSVVAGHTYYYRVRAWDIEQHASPWVGPAPVSVPQ